MAEHVPESRKRSRSPRVILWDDLSIQQVVRPQGKGRSRTVHPLQTQIMDSYKLDPIDGKRQSYLVVLPSRLDPPRIIKELRRLAKKHLPQLVLFSNTEGPKVYLWTQLASEVELRTRGGRRPRQALPQSENGAKVSDPAPGVETTSPLD